MELYTGWMSLWKIFTTFWALVHKNTHPTHQGYKRHNHQTSTSNKVHMLQRQGKTHTTNQGKEMLHSPELLFASAPPGHPTKIHTSQQSLKNTQVQPLSKYTSSAEISQISNQHGNCLQCKQHALG
jgi:hypothetical protein